MSIEQRSYEKDFVDCAVCKCRRPFAKTRAVEGAPDKRVCSDDWHEAIARNGEVRP